MMSLVAILDRPSAHSFGMAAIVVRRETGLQVLGLRGADFKVIDDSQMDRLDEEGHAQRIPNEVVVTVPNSNDLVAGWLGNEFQAELRRLYQAYRIPILPNLAKTSTVQGGQFWIGPPSQVHQQMDRWLRSAAREVFATSNRLSAEDRQRLARLMAWTLPARDETKSALWFTKGSAADRERELEWLVRLERDAGRPVSIRDYESRLQGVVDKFQKTISTRAGASIFNSTYGTMIIQLGRFRLAWLCR